MKKRKGAKKGSVFLAFVSYRRWWYNSTQYSQAVSHPSTDQEMQSGQNAGVQKWQQHPVFPGGLPSKYWPGPMLLNFSDQTRTGVFNMVWPLPREEVTFGKKEMQSGLNAGMRKWQQHTLFPGGLPSKYWPGLMLLNFSDRTRTGVLNMVWPLPEEEGKLGGKHLDLAWLMLVLTAFFQSP